MSEVHDKKDLRKIAINNVSICDYYAPFILKNKNEELDNFKKMKGE